MIILLAITYMVPVPTRDVLGDLITTLKFFLHILLNDISELAFLFFQWCPLMNIGS